MRVILLALALFVMTVASDKCEERCAKCAVVERSECLAGMEKDPECGCCDICSRFEGQKCDMKDTPFKFGHCGDGLECTAIGDDNICQCAWVEIICGSDNVTYDNLCQMMAAAVRESKRQTMEVKSRGPCDPGAQIITKPEYVRNTTENTVVLSCEAIGYPTPVIRWVVTKANNKTFDMPGDDNHILVATRGGPGKYQTTSWLQIDSLKKIHEGDYTCFATNELKEDRAKARIKVIN
jgi:hypothetical protein